MRWLAGLAALWALSGCGALGQLLLPSETVQITNNTTVSVTVRVGSYVATAPAVSDAQAIDKATLAPKQATTFTLPIGHYALFAEDQTASADDAVTDFTLSRGTTATADLEERLEDRAGTHDSGPGYEAHQLGWSVH